jgi:tetratricopeptide (TPR) repeat protein
LLLTLVVVCTPAARGQQRTREYTHVDKRFVLRCPASWKVIREVTDGQVQHGFTPQADARRIKDIDVGLTVMITPTDDEFLALGRSPATVLKQLLPMIRFAEPGLKAVGRVRPARLGRLEAAVMTLAGTIKDKQGAFQGQMLLGMEGRYGTMVGTIAPRQQYERMAPVFEKILRESDFGTAPARRRPRELTPSQIVARYKASVVAVQTEEGGGTGFVVSPEGYVLTNCHVIYDYAKKRPFKEIFVEWDDSLRRPKVAARLVAYCERESKEVFLGGIDVALLKIPPGDYTPIPLTALADVRLGDGVVSLGFPQRGKVIGVSLFVTRGIVVRYNRNHRGRVESIFTDAKIAGGSSGGPCISLATGGVIGLNTWRQPIVVAGRGTRLNDMVGYYSVCTAEDAMAEFPLVTRLGRGHDGSDLDFLEAFELSKLLFHQGSGRAAVRMANRAAELKPDSADAFFQLGLCAFRVGAETRDKQTLQTAEEAIRKALQIDPKHESALVGMAVGCQRGGKHERALGFADRAVAAHPDSWQVHYLRAQLLTDMRRYAEALPNLKKAKQLSLKILPQPYVLSGMAHYAAGKLEAGKADFEEAARIHPASLDAHLGACQYHEHKRQYDRAIARYEAILPQFKHHPSILARIGECHLRRNRLDEAAKCFTDAVNWANVDKRTPPAGALLGLGEIHQKHRRDARRAVRWYATFLLHYGELPAAAMVHAKLADLYGESLPAIPYAHLRRASALVPTDAAVRLALRKATQAGLSDTNLVRMLNLHYPIAVVADLLHHAPVSFRLTGPTSAERLSRRGIPHVVIVAVDESLKRFPIVASAGVRNAGLVGTWQAPIADAQGRTVGQVRLEFAGSRGRYALVRTETRTGAAPRRETGWWNSTDRSVWGRLADRGEWTSAYKIQDDRLTVQLDLAGGGKRVYRRVPGTAPG